MAAGCIFLSIPAADQPKDAVTYPAPIAGYFGRTYDEKAQRLAFRPDYPGGFGQWQRDARAALRSVPGLDRVAASVGAVRPIMALGPPEDFGEFTRQSGTIEGEPGVPIPFWLLTPKRPPPWPVGVFPHGHTRAATIRPPESSPMPPIAPSHSPRIATWRSRA